MSKGLEVQIFRDLAGEWRFRIRSAGNHEIVATSESYKNHGDAVATAQLVTEATGASWIDLDPQIVTGEQGDVSAHDPEESE